MKTLNVFRVSKNNHPSKLMSNAKILGAVVLLAGGTYGVAYNQLFLPQTPVTAVVVREVHYEDFSGNKSVGHNIVNLKIEQGKDAGQEAVARFYFSSNAQQFKTGDRVSGLLSTSRITKKHVVDDLVRVTPPQNKM